MTSWTTAADPRFGANARFVKSMSMSTPGGKQISAAGTRTAVLATPTDPLSLTSLTETTTFGTATHSTTYTTSTRKLTSTSAEGRVTSVTYDSAGHPTLLEAPGALAVAISYDGGVPVAITQGTRTVTMGYVNGRLTSITDPESKVTTFTHDAVGRPTRATLPGGALLDVAYDESGNITGVTPPGRPEHKFSYDGDDRSKTYTPPDPSGTESAVALTTLYSSDGIRRKWPRAA